VPGPGQDRSIVVVFVARGDGEPALPHQGQKIVFNPAGIARVRETSCGVFGESVGMIQLPERQATGIRGYPATCKIGDDLLGEKAFRDELFMADCFPRISRLRG